LAALGASFAWPGLTTYTRSLIAIVALAGLVLFAPVPLTERVTVDDTHFEVHPGMWFQTATLHVEFDKLQAIALEQGETGGRRSRVIDVLVLRFKDSSVDTLPLNNDVKISGAIEILARANKRGVRVLH
jgi:hypothetical protein